MKKQNKLFKLTVASMLLALAFVLPYLTANNRELGNALCLMHIPVLLCGFFCGGPWGLVVGFIAPLLRFFIIGAPPMPIAATMAFELAAYGLMSGILYRAFPKKKIFIYCSLIISMIAGRLVLGVANFVVSGADYGLEAFWTGAVVNAIPGIILQIVLIPVVVMALEKVKFINKNK